MKFEAALSSYTPKPATLERPVEGNGPDRIGWVRGEVSLDVRFCGLGIIPLLSPSYAFTV
jgi:hypothetical protein